jgi:hypothetical protein
MILKDFQYLNANSEDDRYSMKNTNKCIRDIEHAGSKTFTTLDLTSGFWQMPLEEQSKHLTTFMWLRVDHKSNGTPGMSNLISKFGGDVHESV